MAYYECLNNNDHISIGDSFTVNLTGSHNTSISASVCYIDKTTVCLLGDTSLGNADWPTQCKYNWNYTVNIKGKKYTGTCRIPTIQQIYSKCAGYKRDFGYWTSIAYNAACAWYVSSYGHVYYEVTHVYYDILPFIEITL